MHRIRTDRVPGLDDTILKVAIVSDMDVVQYNGILDHAIVSDICLFKYNGIFNHTVYDTSAAHQRVLNLGPDVILCRRQIVNL